MIAERNAAGEDLLDILPNSRVAFGLRTVDGSFNNLVRIRRFRRRGHPDFPLQLDPVFRNDLDGDTLTGPGGTVTNTDYASTANVADADPRIICNLIVDQTANNPAAAGRGAPIVMSPGLDGIFGTADDRTGFLHPQRDAGRGPVGAVQPVVHVLRPVLRPRPRPRDKGGNGTVFIPLQADDPLIAGADGIFGNGDDLPVNQRFMVLTRATNTVGPAPTASSAPPTTSRTKTRTPLALRRSEPDLHLASLAPGVPARVCHSTTGGTVATGRLITNRDLGDGEFGNADGANLAAWPPGESSRRRPPSPRNPAHRHDVFDMPLLATDAYGRFIPGA